jgi:NADH:ubiquinone oxidoreductase subunit 5 (subunit L)/multisubunit Na+/H+ antiporter MnhA subunit
MEMRLSSLVVVALLGGVTPGSVLGVSIDPLSVVLSVLIIGLSAVIQCFALRYLRGDPRRAWWVVWANLLTGATTLMVNAPTIVLFAAGWTAAGACLVALLDIYRRLPGARQGTLRAAVRFAIGDLALVLAVALLVIGAGHDIRLSDLSAAVADLPPAAQLTAALLLVLPALSRSTQIPFHRWLPSSLTTPTPVSALLHAGVVNAGAILVIRFAPAITTQPLAMAALFTAGAATLVYASAVRLVKPDVKGRLVFSTMAQMGYMIMACGLGAFPAVLLHLVAHSLFKSSLFLGAGNGIRSRAVERDWPRDVPRRRRVVVAAWLLAASASVAAFFAATTTLGTRPGDPVTPLIVFVIVTAGVAAARWLLIAWSPVAILVSVFAIAALAFGYTGLLDLVTVAVPLPTAVAPVSAWFVTVPIVALAAIQVVATRGGRPTPVRARLYARLLASSLPPASPRKELAS